MKQATLSQALKAKVFSNVNLTLRGNKNGYPYLTFLRNVGGKTFSNNIYFGKKSAELMKSQGTVVGDQVNQYLKEIQIIRINDEDMKQAKFKLSINTSDYTSSGQLADLLGVEEAADFNFQELISEFTTTGETQATPVEETVEAEEESIGF